MELSSVMKSRRSIRAYKDMEIDKNVIIELVKDAQLAPSWKNSQTARYYVAHSKEMRQRLLNCLHDFNKERTSNASAFIVTTVVHGISGYSSSGRETHLGNGFECFDNGLAVQNLLLSATEKGLGSLVMGLYNEQAIRELFGIPETENIVVVLALGYADISPDMPERKSIDEILTIK